MQQKFTADEKVLCYHGPLLYEAKILKSKKESGNYSYFVHYQGWNKNWDEWVQEGRIMKQVPESYEKQKKLLMNHAAANKAQKKAVKDAKAKKKGGSDSGANSRASTPVGDRIPSRQPKRSIADDERSNSSRDDDTSNPASTSSTPVVSKEGRVKRRKEGGTDVDEGSRDVLSDDPVDSKYQIDLPEDLRHVLVNDWDLVVHQKHLVKIPAKVTVSNIIEQYVHHLDSTDLSPARKSSATEVIKGLGEYFNVSLGTQLLYSVEKLQYREDCESAGAVQPADIYGSNHLLRLMVKVGSYLSCSNFQESGCKMIDEHIDDFLAYLDINRSMIFSSKNYQPASADYLQRC